MITCQHCNGWGEILREGEHPCPIRCPECKRPTWPNAGVNFPAGMVWIISACTAAEHLRHLADSKGKA